MLVLLVVTLALFNGALSTSVLKCSNGQAPLEVRIKDCDKPPCKLVRGTDVVLDVVFKAPADTKSLEPRVKATALGATIDYALPADQKDACKHLVGGNCPIKANQEVNYHLVMPVSTIYPKVSVDLTYSLVDDSKKDVTCFKVPCVVVD